MVESSGYTKNRIHHGGTETRGKLKRKEMEFYVNVNRKELQRRYIPDVHIPRCDFPEILRASVPPWWVLLS
jgi:hypothetical protein